MKPINKNLGNTSLHATSEATTKRHLGRQKPQFYVTDQSGTEGAKEKKIRFNLFCCICYDTSRLQSSKKLDYKHPLFAALYHAVQDILTREQNKVRNCISLPRVRSRVLEDSATQNRSPWHKDYFERQQMQEKLRKQRVSLL